MCMTFVAALFEVWKLESRLKTEKKKIIDEENKEGKGEINVGLNA